MANPFATAIVPSTAQTFSAPAVQVQTPQKVYAAPAPQEVDFDSDVPSSSLEFFPTLDDGQRTRVAFVLFNPPKEGATRPSPRWLHAQYFSKFYKKGDPRNIKKFLAPTNPILHQKCAQVCGDVKTVFGTVVLHYTTDTQGRIVPNSDYKFRALTGNRDHWDDVKNQHELHGVDCHDVQVKGADKNFQKRDYDACGESVWLSAPEDIQQEILAKATELFTGPLGRMLAASRTDEEIEEILRQHTGPVTAPAQPTPGHNPFVRGFAPSLTTPPATAALTGKGPAQSATFSDLISHETQTVDPTKTA